MKRSEYEELGYSKLLGEQSIEEFEFLYNIPDSDMRLYAVIRESQDALKHPDPYFRIIKWKHDDENIYISRLSMIKPEYVKTEHEDHELSNIEIDLLINHLTNHTIKFHSFIGPKNTGIHPVLEPLIEADNTDISVWKYIVYTMNDYLLLDKLISKFEEAQWYEPIDYDLPIPDYNLLKK